MTLRPPHKAHPRRKLSREQLLWMSFFGITGVAAFVLIIWGSVRAETEKREAKTQFDATIANLQRDLQSARASIVADVNKAAETRSKPSPEWISMHQRVSALLGRGAALLQACDGGPSPECKQLRPKWEADVGETLRRYGADPSGYPRWASVVLRYQNFPSGVAVASESDTLADILSKLH